MSGLREALEAGYDEIEAGPTTETVETEAAETPSPEPVDAAPVETAPTERPAESRSRDDSGRFAKGGTRTATEASPAPLKAKTSTASAVPGAATATPAVPTQAPGQPTRAPQSWKPELREKFSSLPPEVQAEAARVERTYQKIIQENAQLKQQSQSANPYQEALRPYEATIRASGMEGHQYVGNIMQQVHALSYGPDHVKADVLAGIVAQYGGHLLQPNGQDGTSPLDRALAARLQGRQAQALQGQFQDPRVDQLFSALQQRKQQTEQQAETEAGQRLEAMASNPEFEFFGDVAPAMEQILRFWASQGKRQVDDASLKKAYDWACRENPDVAAVYEQRKAAEAARKAQASTERARNAASSPRSQPTDAPAARPKGLRAALESGYDDLASR